MPIDAKPEEPKKTKKVVFFNISSVPNRYLVKSLAKETHRFAESVVLPLGPLYLAATLERDIPDVDVRIVDMAKRHRHFVDNENSVATTIENFIADLLEDDLEPDFVPDVFGISVLFSLAHETVRVVAKQVKKRWPNTTIIVGGNHATNAYHKLLETEDIHYVFRGEGEAVISDLVEVACAGGDIETIPGVIGHKTLEQHKASNSPVTETAPLIEDLDAIPFPAWHLVPMKDYIFSVGVTRTRRFSEISADGQAPIMTTRGCPFSCTFCASWTVHGRKMRFRSKENVVAELKILHEKYGVSIVSPEDDLFTVKKDRIIELCKAVTKEFKGNLSFQFPNGLSVATLDRDVIDAMVDMGMEIANIAVESGSNEVQRKIIKKNCNLDRARKVVKECRDKGIYTRAYFVLGFPGETKEQMLETIDFANSLPTDWNTFSVAAPLYGSEMYTQFEESGIIDESYRLDQFLYEERAFDTPEIGAKELNDLMYSANIRINFFENYNIRNEHYDRAADLFSNIIVDYPWHVVAHYCLANAQKKAGNLSGHDKSMQKCKELLGEEGSELAKDLYRRFHHYFDDQFKHSLPQTLQMDQPQAAEN